MKIQAGVNLVINLESPLCLEPKELEWGQVRMKARGEVGLVCKQRLCAVNGCIVEVAH